MSKLIFEDDNGNQFDVDIKSVQIENIKPGDIIIVSYEIGDIPREKSEIALESLKNLIKPYLPSNTNLMVIAKRNGIEDISIKVMDFKELKKE